MKTALKLFEYLRFFKYENRYEEVNDTKCQQIIKTLHTIYFYSYLS